MEGRYSVKEENGKLYHLTPEGEVISEMNEPAVAFQYLKDRDLLTIQAFGNRVIVEKQHNDLLELNAYFHKMAARDSKTDPNLLAMYDSKNFYLRELPKDVEFLNEVFEDNSLIRTLYKDVFGERTNSMNAF